MSRRRYRGSVIGRYVKPTSTTASGVYDLDTEIINTGLARWPSAPAGLYQTPLRAIFGFGINSTPTALAVTNLVSTTGVVAADVTLGAGYQARGYAAAAGYGLDKAVFHGGAPTGNGGYNNVNLVNNTGTMSADEVTLPPSPNYKTQAGGATFGLNKAIFTFGYYNPSGTGQSQKNCMIYSDTGVWSNDYNTTVAGFHSQGRATGYGNDLAVAISDTTRSAATGGTSTGITAFNYISNTGLVSAETNAASTSVLYATGFATRYGVGTALLLYVNSSTATDNTYAYITNTGTVGSDTQITLGRITGGSTTYAGGNAIMFGCLATSISTARSLYVSNTGTIGTDSTVAGLTGRGGTCGAGYSLA